MSSGMVDPGMVRCDNSSWRKQQDILPTSVMAYGTGGRKWEGRAL